MDYPATMSIGKTYMSIWTWTDIICKFVAKKLYINKFYREICGMPKACSWSSPPEEISPHLWAKFSTLYDAPSDIDLFSAGLAETLLPGAHVGPTFACIIGRQVGYYSKGSGNNTLGLCYTRE